ncbi:hypothetical protein R5H30_03505 [Sulfitobacter sp. D35]|uniref:hypothetical protein n=1 Tax=Sulfitobacter sp. D35 TaxID=3083252 RepID=UPI00296E3092|nr:hypothetical protein [Sulfitobacter sp. D35]MDW4497035.1 hypothetical protein [Sulfitobacter sp. D35]
MRAAVTLLKLALVALVCLTLAIGGAVAWIETQCHGAPSRQSPARFIEAPQDRRPEARSFLTYPEWHIVFAYADYAQVLKGGAPQDFAYWPAVRDFWRSSCVMAAEADRYGSAGPEARRTLYVIGASFSIEMAAKALYENTLGRVSSLAGSNSAQDAVEAEMASVYAEFLQQEPWYRFDFQDWRDRLWTPPVENPVRGWERRLALGAEWSAKALYAGAISGAVAATGGDETRMLLVVSRVAPDAIADLPSGRLVAPVGAALLLDVPRYGIFTTTVQAIAAIGGEFVEIAGNDDILVSILSRVPPRLPGTARLLHVVERFDGRDRYLVAVPVESLAGLLRTLRFGPARVEHVYDY